MAWAAWTLGGWQEYAGRAGFNCVDWSTEDVFLGERGIGAVGLFLGVWALNGRRGYAVWDVINCAD